jgi:hypothetical protein
MPTYLWRCLNDHRFDRYSTVDGRNDPQICECGASARRIITAAQIFVQPDVHYDSPIDGRPITSMQARREDLARSGCQPYDPMMKQDTDRRIERETLELENKIEETVEAQIHDMPSRKREKLAAELEGGVTAEPTRVTVQGQSMKVSVDHG